jgi:hypothetical protein
MPLGGFKVWRAAHPRAAADLRNVKGFGHKLESYLRNVEQNNFKKIYPAKAQRRKVKNIFRNLRTWRLGVPSTSLRTCFAGVISFSIS